MYLACMTAADMLPSSVSVVCAYGYSLNASLLSSLSTASGCVNSVATCFCSVHY